MNKQVISFLSLFSLVLVLSVYYVMMPSGLFANNGNEDTITNGGVDDSNDLLFETLAIKLKAKHQDAIDEQMTIVASSDISNDEKSIALERIQTIKDIQKLEQDAIAGIKAEGYVLAHAELLDNSKVDILVAKNNPDPVDAVKVMQVAFATFGTDVNPIVNFK